MVRFAIFLLSFALVCSAAHAERRVALVIGNSAYTVGPLANPGNDAEAVAKALREIGFDKVILKRDLSLAGIRAALKEFAGEIAGAEIGAVFFAGHGTEIGGRNYLIPVDARLARAADIELEAVSLDTVLNQLEGATRLKLVILDACRNNIFPLAGGRRSQTRGLARVEPEDNTLIAYAAREGTTADDGGGPHSPFTTALLKHVGTPGLEVDYVFRLVRDDVIAATGRQQQPHLYGSLGRERIVLRPGPPPAVDSAVPPASPRPQSALEPLDLTIRAMLRKVVVDGKEQARLGIKIATLDAGTLSVFGEDARHGVLVSGLSEDGAAGGVGLRPLDLIMEIDGFIPKDGQHFAKLVADRPPGQTVELRIRRLAASTTEALQGLHRLAGHSRAAQAMLGQLYDQGIVVEEKSAQAAHWYGKAAEAGDVGSMAKLGVLHAKGRGMPRDDAQAVRWYRKAAQAGNTRAMNNLGAMLDVGRGGAKDSKEAAQWCFRALRAGDDFVIKDMRKNAKAWSPEFQRELLRLVQEQLDGKN